MILWLSVPKNILMQAWTQSRQSTVPELTYSNQKIWGCKMFQLKGLLPKRKNPELQEPSLPEKPKSLQDLSNQQVELAFQWLSSPELAPFPQELDELNQAEWFLLNSLLESLQQEKQNSQVH